MQLKARQNSWRRWCMPISCNCTEFWNSLMGVCVQLRINPVRDPSPQNPSRDPRILSLSVESWDSCWWVEQQSTSFCCMGCRRSCACLPRNFAVECSYWWIQLWESYVGLSVTYRTRYYPLRRYVRPSWTCSAQSREDIYIYMYTGFKPGRPWEDMTQLRELRSNFYRITRLLSLRKKTEYINNIQNRSDFAAKGRAERELQNQARSKLVRCSEKRSSQRVKVYEYMKVTWALCLRNKMCCTCRSRRTVTGFSTCAGGGTLLYHLQKTCSRRRRSCCSGPCCRFVFLHGEQCTLLTFRANFKP